MEKCFQYRVRKVLQSLQGQLRGTNVLIAFLKLFEWTNFLYSLGIISQFVAPRYGIISVLL